MRDGDQVGYARLEVWLLSSRKTGEEVGPALEVVWLETTDGSPASVRRLICEVLRAAFELHDSGYISTMCAEFVNDRLRDFALKNADVRRLSQMPFMHVMKCSELPKLRRRLCRA